MQPKTYVGQYRYTLYIDLCATLLFYCTRVRFPNLRQNRMLAVNTAVNGVWSFCEKNRRVTDYYNGRLKITERLGFIFCYTTLFSTVKKTNDNINSQMIGTTDLWTPTAVEFPGEIWEVVGGTKISATKILKASSNFDYTRYYYWLLLFVMIININLAS